MRTGKIVYVAGYGLKKNNGRSKATREKVEALRDLPCGQHFRFHHPASTGITFVDYLLLIFFDLQMLARASFFPANTVVIQRQTVLFLTNTLLRLRGIMIVSEVHADSADEFRLLNKPGYEKSLLRILLRAENYTLSISKGIICNHPLLADAMKKRFGKPCIAVYNGANTEGFTILDTTACRDQLHLDRGGKFFLFIGMISRWHGVEHLIDIFRLKEMEKYTLLLVGAVDNQYVESLRQRATGFSNIVLVPHVDVKASQLWINAADVCLLPVNNLRVSPGSPLKLYDYISCGKPVMAQAGVLGYSDEVERWGLGAVIDFNDVVKAKAMLTEFIEHADKAFYAENNRRVAVQKVSWKQRMSEWLEFIDLLTE